MYKVQMNVELECDVDSPEKALQEASYRLPGSYSKIKIVGCELSCHAYQQDTMSVFNDDDFDSEVPVELGEPVSVPVVHGTEALD